MLNRSKYAKHNEDRDLAADMQAYREYQRARDVDTGMPAYEKEGDVGAYPEGRQRVHIKTGGAHQYTKEYAYT